MLFISGVCMVVSKMYTVKNFVFAASKFSDFGM